MKSFARIDGFIARDANMAVLIRRGPTKWVRFFIWDFASDQVVKGDWMKARLYSRQGDITPDGKYLVSSVLGHSEHGDAIVLTQPPSSKVLCGWRCDTSYGSGGLWKNNHTLLLSYRHLWSTINRSPKGLRVQHPRRFEGQSRIQLLYDRLEKGGWTTTDASNLQLLSKVLSRFLPRKYPLSMTKEFRGGRIKLKLFGPPAYLETAEVTDSTGGKLLLLEAKDGHPTWIDTDPSGRLVFAERGRLFVWPEFPAGEPHLVADLNDFVTDRPPSNTRT